MAQPSMKLFEPQIVNEIMSNVKGHSSLAALCNAKPIPFTGTGAYTFNIDSEIDVIDENGAKSHGGFSMDKVTTVPVKVEYGARVPDEFMYATEERKLEILKAFIEGCQMKIASGFDLMAFHGINPRTGTKSTIIGANNFDDKVTATVTYDSTAPDQNIEDAIGIIEDGVNEGEVNGIAMSPAMRTAFSKMEAGQDDKHRLYPEFQFGAKPNNLGKSKLDVNGTVSKKVGGSSGTIMDHAIVGDFQNSFRWGFAKDMFYKVIEYGDPDNTGVDLAGHNQVYLRVEAYIAWAIFRPQSFCRVTP